MALHSFRTLKKFPFAELDSSLPSCPLESKVALKLQEVCTMRSIPVPAILSESGRALASHHAVMVFDVLTRRVASFDTASNSCFPSDSKSARGSDGSFVACCIMPDSFDDSSDLHIYNRNHGLPADCLCSMLYAIKKRRIFCDLSSKSEDDSPRLYAGYDI